MQYSLSSSRTDRRGGGLCIIICGAWQNWCYHVDYAVDGDDDGDDDQIGSSIKRNEFIITYIYSICSNLKSLIK